MPGLSDESVEALDAIVFERYAGRTDGVSAPIVRGQFEKVNATGLYDREMVLADARHTKHETSIQRLEKILTGSRKRLGANGSAQADPVELFGSAREHAVRTIALASNTSTSWSGSSP